MRLAAGTADVLAGGGTEPLRRRLGAVPLQEGGVELRVWAPQAGSLAVDLADGRHELEGVGDGVHEARLDATAGDDYLLVVDGAEAYPDPCSRAQPHGVRGPSRIVDTGAFS